MERFTSQAIILAKTDYGEADRIITFITPRSGKIKAIAKGARKSRSKLAGALELFSVSEILLLPGKKDVSTLMSAKLVRHYSNIVKNLDSTNAAYEITRLINKATQDKAEESYFYLLDNALAGLDQKIKADLCNLWFKVHLLKLTGHQPELKLDRAGNKLSQAKSYSFDFDKMCFYPADGSIKTDDIKFLRVTFAAATPKVLSRVEAAEALFDKGIYLVTAMLDAHLNL